MLRLGLGWAKSHAFFTGQCPVMRYNRQLMMAILHDRVRIADNVNATPIPLEQAPQGYAEFDQGACAVLECTPSDLLVCEPDQVPVPQLQHRIVDGLHLNRVLSGI